MGLNIGIVGLPNVGKSTIFNALTRAQNAESANYPFCTIEPNKATVPLKDPRIDLISEFVKPQKTIYATVDFVDIAGLVKGASRGEGLGNKFLANIREANAILHVVRCFDDENIVHVDGSVDPLRDIEVIETELILADLQSIERQLERVQKQAKGDKKLLPLVEIVNALVEHLNTGHPVSSFGQRDDADFEFFLKQSSFLTDKRVVYAMNIGEDEINKENSYVKAVKAHAEKSKAGCVTICAKIEEDMIGLSDQEAAELLQEYGLKESALQGLTRIGYDTLGLQSFFTAGPKEVRAWTIEKGWKAPQAAGVIHTDFERGFIRAQVIKYEDYLQYKSVAACRTAGVLRTEGKDYVMEDGDVVEFLFNV
ncbi:MAG: redox-regulated ATPase YchF [Bdellovibrionota bacterium]|jgi:GTP-binding protein YchF